MLPRDALDVRGPARRFQARAQVGDLGLVKLDREGDRGGGHRGVPGEIAGQAATAARRKKEENKKEEKEDDWK